MDETSYIDPNAYDVDLSDVTHDLLLIDIAERLEVEYLATPEITESPRSVSGMLHGANLRPIVNLVVASKRQKSQLISYYL